MKKAISFPSKVLGRVIEIGPGKEYTWSEMDALSKQKFNDDQLRWLDKVKRMFKGRFYETD